ncbi:hypothetical protein [Streptomyces nanshensis]|uniref:hypothetical protein n=1 Tax=Streptomyces nanshensis TaxID=518642 RepID=UPI001495F5B8|nr:hypothetical protein [Streptomyces nanshensis]
MWGPTVDRAADARRRPWLYDPAEFPQPEDDTNLHLGCSDFPVPTSVRRLPRRAGHH